MPFKDVIGQEEVKHHLAEMVHHNRLSHALLFLGKEGSGALALALAFAQFIVCEKQSSKKTKTPEPAGLFGFDEPAQEQQLLFDACGDCSGCQKSKQHIHPDIHFSYPIVTKKPAEKPKSSVYGGEWREFIIQSPYGNVFDWLQSIGAENKQGNISVEECNDIIRKLSLKSFESETKVLIMWMPEYLGAAGNKLLKLIEEPPSNTIFLLVAESEEKILQTILSRTQLVKIPLLDVKEIEKALIERNNTPPEQALQIAALSEGNYHEALQITQHAGEDWLNLLRDWMNVIAKGGPSAHVKWIEEVAKLGREKQKQFLKYFNHIIEQCIRLRIMGEAHVLLTETELDFAQRFNKISSVTQQQAIISETDKAAYYIERNANGKMLFHALTIKMQHLIKNKVLISAV